MSEGRNPALGCAFGCVGARCGWVPPRSSPFPRRDPLIDAVGRTDNPCDRPARCPPCCKPTPKFRPPQEKPACNIDCFREEQAAAKIREYCEQRQKYLDRYCPEPTPEFIVESLDPVNTPIAVEMPSEPPPEEAWFLKDSNRCKTDIIAGFFNPNDNKLREELKRAECDPFYMSCGPSLPQYPCRGVISYPRQEWVNLAQEKKLCLPPGCEGSKYLNPDYLEAQKKRLDEIKFQSCLEDKRKRDELIRSSGYRTPHPCCPERLSQTPFCTCNDNFC